MRAVFSLPMFVRLPAYVVFLCAALRALVFPASDGAPWPWSAGYDASAYDVPVTAFQVITLTVIGVAWLLWFAPAMLRTHPPHVVQSRGVIGTLLVAGIGMAAFAGSFYVWHSFVHPSQEGGPSYAGPRITYSGKVPTVLSPPPGYEALQKFRKKYPEYNDIPDQDLAQQILKKYPKYQDVLGPWWLIRPSVSLSPNGLSFNGNRFVEADIYNGSDQAVRNVTISIVLRGPDGKMRFTREYKLLPEDSSGVSSPLNSSRYLGEVGFTPKAGESITWDIIDATVSGEQ
jgi:hypothetical protein